MTKNTDKKNEVFIFKSNDLAQNTITSLTATQNKMLIVLLGKFILGAVAGENSQIEGKMIDSEISVNEYLQLLEITNCKDNYEMIRREAATFHKNSIVKFTNERGYKGTIAYFDKVIYDEQKDAVVFTWSNSIQPYLIGLSGCYTSYLQSNFLLLKTKRSQIMYEWMKSFQYQGRITIGVQALRERLDALDKSYDEFKKFNDKVLKKAIEEVNKYTDITVTTTSNRKNKKIQSITFDITTNEKNIKKKWGPYQNVLLSYEEYLYITEKLKEDNLITILSEWKSKGNRCRNDYQTIMKWHEKGLPKAAYRIKQEVGIPEYKSTCDDNVDLDAAIKKIRESSKENFPAGIKDTPLLNDEYKEKVKNLEEEFSKDKKYQNISI